MIIPVKCFTCGKVLADKYRWYKEKISDKKKSKDPEYFSETNSKKTIEGLVMDELKLTKPCCRRHMITHVDIE